MNRVLDTHKAGVFFHPLTDFFILAGSVHYLAPGPYLYGSHVHLGAPFADLISLSFHPISVGLCPFNYDQATTAWAFHYDYTIIGHEIRSSQTNPKGG